MGETKWTPGPWRITPNKSMSNLVEGNVGTPMYDGHDGYRTVASFQPACPPGSTFLDEEANRMANARLIATAPDLYEALADLVEIIDKAGLNNLANGVQLGPTVWYVKASERMDWAQHVLAKARGESTDDR